MKNKVLKHIPITNNIHHILLYLFIKNKLEFELTVNKFQLDSYKHILYYTKETLVNKILDVIFYYLLNKTYFGQGITLNNIPDDKLYFYFYDIKCVLFDYDDLLMLLSCRTNDDFAKLDFIIYSITINDNLLYHSDKLLSDYNNLLSNYDIKFFNVSLFHYFYNNYTNKPFLKKYLYNLYRYKISIENTISIFNVIVCDFNLKVDILIYFLSLLRTNHIIDLYRYINNDKFKFMNIFFKYLPKSKIRYIMPFLSFEDKIKITNQRL